MASKLVMPVFKCGSDSDYIFVIMMLQTEGQYYPGAAAVGRQLDHGRPQIPRTMSTHVHHERV